MIGCVNGATGATGASGAFTIKSFVVSFDFS